jgi:hypothetical protein
MIINENELWNGQLITVKGKLNEECKVVGKHNIFKHEIVWYDPKTTTVAYAVNNSKSDYLKNNYDQVELMLLVKHNGESEGHDVQVLEYAQGIYIEKDNIPKGIFQFRYVDKAKEYQYADIEGELLAFSLIEDLPLMQKFNDIE